MCDGHHIVVLSTENRETKDNWYTRKPQHQDNTNLF